MGCCLTTTAAAVNFKIHWKTRNTSPPMPPGSVEETVKEVLSETPPTNSISIPSKTTPNLHSEDEFKSKDVVVKHPVEKNASEVSFTYSASLSTASTTTLGTGTDIDAHCEVTQTVKKPPDVKMVSRRQQSSPCSHQRARRPVVRSTDKNPQLTSRTAQRKRNMVSSNVDEHKPALRRSRPPALRGEAGHVTVKNSGKRVLRKNDVNIKANDVSVMSVPEPETETIESLENPFISLECFIFL